MTSRAVFFVVLVFVGVVAAACGDENPECFAATTCLKTDCNGPILRSGCDVVCGPGEIDQRKCFGGSDAGLPDVIVADSAADSNADATDAKVEAAADAASDATGE